MYAGLEGGQQQLKLQQQSAVVNEVLRHFWASVPCSTPTREKKAKRMTDELRMRQAALTGILKNDIQNAELAVSTVHAITQAIQAAQTRFELECSKRAVSHHARLLA